MRLFKNEMKMRNKRIAVRAALLLCIAACGLTACGKKKEAADNAVEQKAEAGQAKAVKQADDNSDIEALQKKIESDPTKVQPYIDLHQAYLEKGDYESALQVLDDAWEADVEDPDGKLVNLYTSLVTAVQNNPALMQSEDDDSDSKPAAGGSGSKAEDGKSANNFSEPRDFDDDTSYMSLDYAPMSVSEDTRYELEDKTYWFLMNEDIRHIWEYADGEEKLVIVPGTFSDEKVADLVSMTIRGTMEKRDLARDSHCKNMGKNENGLDEFKMDREGYLSWVDEYFGWDRAEEMGEIPEEYMTFTGMGIEDFSEMDIQLSDAEECEDYVKATFDIVYKWHYSARENETRVTQVIAYYQAVQAGDFTYLVLMHADEV